MFFLDSVIGIRSGGNTEYSRTFIDALHDSITGMSTYQKIVVSKQWERRGSSESINRQMEDLYNKTVLPITIFCLYLFIFGIMGTSPRFHTFAGFAAQIAVSVIVTYSIELTFFVACTALLLKTKKRNLPSNLERSPEELKPEVPINDVADEKPEVSQVSESLTAELDEDEEPFLLWCPENECWTPLDRI